MYRNPDLFIHPVIYAEDGVWTGQGLTQGWLFPLFHARPDYLVMGNVILLWIASQCCLVLFGNPVDHLPQSIAIVSCLFYSAVAAMAFYSTRDIVPLIFRGALFLLLLLVPLGFSQNEIIGRILQIGYYMPLIAIMLFYLKSKCHNFVLRSIIDFFLVLCAATNPIIIGFAAIYFIWDCLENSSIPNALGRNMILNISLLVLSIYMLPRMMCNATNLLEFNIKQLIEAVGARSILFSIIFPWYDRLSNVSTIFLLICWVSLIIYCYSRSKHLLGKRLLLFLSVGLLVTTVATLVMRPGLTTILHEYQTTFPDRYFMGINIITIFLTILALCQLVSSHENKLVFLGWMGLGVISLIYLFHFPLIFEIHSPRMPIMNKLTFEDQIQSVSVIPNSILVEVPICPEIIHLKMRIPSKWINMMKNKK